MPKAASKQNDAALDLRDVDRRVGQLVGGSQLLHPCTEMDIRRWVMAMDYPNPIHWDETFARESQFGEIVAPQSFTTALDCGQGVLAALVGHIPNSLLLYGGDEWWFYGGRIRPGDKHSQERRFHGYKLADTKFAGPTVFSSGDTTHRNQNGVPIAKQRATIVRYLAAEAEKRSATAEPQPPAPVWTYEALTKVDEVRHAWIMSNRDGRTPRFDDVQIGESLPTRAIGPHSVTTFATQHRAFPFNVWGAAQVVGVPGVKDAWINQDPGYPKGFEIDHESGKIDPRFEDGLHAGPSRGHLSSAEGTGMANTRAFGFGAAMNAWTTDYIAYWAGNDGIVRHTNVSYRGLALEGDVAYLNAKVIGKESASAWGGPLISLKLEMTNQDGARVLSGTAEVELPI